MKNVMILMVAAFLMNMVVFGQEEKSAFGKKQLPEVKVKDLSGNDVNIAEFGKNGKISVLSFWATWCSPCKKELNNIAELYDQWVEDYDMEIIAISIDDSRNAANVKSYVNGQGWEYTVLLDTNQDLKRALGFQTIPFTIVVDQSGNIVYTHTGYVEGDEYILEDHIMELTGLK